MTQARCRWLLTAAFTACAVAGAADARADDPTAAVLIDQGIDLREAQRDSEALALFEKAQSLSPSPRGQAQVALAQQALGRWVVAEKNLAAALAEKDDPWIASHRPILERALAVIQGHLGDVQIVGVTSGSVYVDGVRIDDPDALTHLRLEVGRRTLEVRATGMYPFYRVVDLHAGETERVEVAQHRLLDDTTRVSTVTGAADSGRSQRTLGWIFLGGAGLFVATGVAGLVARDVVAGEFNGNPSCTTTPTVNLRSPCTTYEDQGTTGEIVSIVGFVGGGLFGAISLAMLLTAPGKPKASAVAMPTCSPTKGGLACGATATF